MEENFDTYGQVSPLSQKFNFDNTEEKRLDNFSMGQTLGYFDEQRAVLEKKKEEIQGLGKVIDSSYQQMKNASFLSPQAKERAKQSYMSNVKALEEHHSIPRDQRGVDWFAQFENLKNNVNSEDINNDLRNRSLYQEIYKEKVAGNVTDIVFNQWFDDFKANASEGKDYEKSSTMFRNGRPPSSHESLFQTVREVMDIAKFAPEDYDRDGIGNIIGVKDGKGSPWENFMENKLIKSAFDSGYTKFKNLPYDMQQKYMNGQDDVEGTKNYLREIFNNLRFSNNTHYIDQRSNSEKINANVDVMRDYYMPAIMDSKLATSEEEISQVERTFYAPYATFLRSPRSNVSFNNIEIPIDIPTGKFLSDGKTAETVKKTLRYKNFNVSPSDNYKFVDQTGPNAQNSSKMSTYKFGNPDGKSNDQLFRMHDQNIVLNEDNMKTILEKNLIRYNKKDNKNEIVAVLVNEFGEEEPISMTDLAIIKKKIGETATLDHFLDPSSGGGSFLDTSMDGNVSIVSGKRRYTLGNGIVGGISLNGISNQTLNLMYARGQGVNNIGGSVSTDRSGLINKDNVLNYSTRPQ